MNQGRTARTVMPGQGRQNRAASTGLQGPRTERRRKPEKERHVRQLEQDSSNGTARMGQSEQDCKDRASRTGLPAQDGQHRAAKIRQPGQNIMETMAEKTARTGQLDRTADLFILNGTVRTG
jgi:hypothetical protein